MNTQTNQKNHNETRVSDLINSAYKKAPYYATIAFEILFFIGLTLLIASMLLDLLSDSETMEDIFWHIGYDHLYELKFYGWAFIIMSAFYNLAMLIVVIVDSLLIKNPTQGSVPQNFVSKNYCDVCYKTCGNLTKVTINNEEVNICENCYKDLLKNYNQYQQ